MSRRFDRIAAGAAAGFLATAPMTALMIAWHRRLPWSSQQPLPPAQITGEALRSVELADNLSAEEAQIATVVNHFAYGAAMGAAFGCLPGQRSATSAATAGVAYGLGVWGASYLGWLPATGLHAGATEETSERNAMMIAAHVVWGGALGLVAHALLQAAGPHRSSKLRRDSRIGEPELTRSARHILPAHVVGLRAGGRRGANELGESSAEPGGRDDDGEGGDDEPERMRDDDHREDAERHLNSADD